jgi:hypothetical protein
LNSLCGGGGGGVQAVVNATAAKAALSAAVFRNFAIFDTSKGSEHGPMYIPLSTPCQYGKLLNIHQVGYYSSG